MLSGLSIGLCIDGPAKLEEKFKKITREDVQPKIFPYQIYWCRDVLHAVPAQKRNDSVNTMRMFMASRFGQEDCVY